MDYAAQRRRKQHRENYEAAARAMLAALEQIIGQRDRPHGFPDNDWYEPAFEGARVAIAQAKAAGIGTS